MTLPTVELDYHFGGFAGRAAELDRFIADFETDTRYCSSGSM
jgi:hypothetical protein